jgi:glycosyltransferase involved in cell wall biosynthesis
MLVGASPPDEVRALASEDILVTGQVEDLRPWFDRARVLAAGIRYGAGVKGKVATAMSHGVPVVATTIAAEGMELEHERHVMIADDPADFARRIVELYRDEALWTRLSQAGLTFVRDRNSVPVGIRIQTEAIGKAQHRLRRRALERARAIAAQITA